MNQKISPVSQAERLVKLCIQNKITVAGAESCTGGLIAKEITDIAGSSAMFCGACVTYTNEAKMNMIGVPASVIDEHTEVSYACAEAMAQGAKHAFATDIAYSTTGYAGPGGGTEKDPVGTVYIGISNAACTVSHRLSLPTTATRTEVREAAASFILSELVNIILSNGAHDHERK